MKIAKKIQTPISDIIEKFEFAFESIEKSLVNRSDEVMALKLCFLCNSHLMLEGPAGVAKSKLAESAFHVVEDPDLVRFNIQMMPNTQAEEIFGPMSIKSLREDEIIRYNTKKMLPSAHFAYLDETYRGSDSVLSTMMGILNERVFHNGQNVQKCPLITAVGTTNFITDKPELEAFHDRWLINCQVSPADSGASRQRILELFLEDKPVFVGDPLSLSDLYRLQTAVKAVTLSPLIRDVYEELVEKYRSASSAYVSDRRYCQAARLIQAAILLSSKGENLEHQSVGNVTASRYAIIRGSTKEHHEAMDNALTTVIGNFERAEKEEPDILFLEESVKKERAKYDDKLSKTKKKALLFRANDQLNGITSLPVDQQFTHPKNQSRLTKVVNTLIELKRTLEADLGVDLNTVTTKLYQ